MSTGRLRRQGCEGGGAGWQRSGIVLGLLLAFGSGQEALGDTAPLRQVTVTYGVPDAYGRIATTTTLTEVYPAGSNPARNETLTETVTQTFTPTVDLTNGWAQQDLVLCSQEHRVQTSALLVSPLTPSDVTHYTALRYDALGQLVSQTVDPTSSNCTNPGVAQPSGYAVMTQDYYDFGALKSKTLVAAQNVPTAQLNAVVSQLTYDPTGTWLQSSKNALNQQTSRTVEAGTGNLLTETDPNLLQTQYQYDNFGRAQEEDRPDNTKVVSTPEWCSDVGCTADAVNAVVRVTTVAQTGAGGQIAPTSRVYYDMLNRVVLKEVQSAASDGRWIVAARKEYNARGQVTRSANPYFAGDTSLQWTVYSYDDLGRTSKVQAPDANGVGGYATTVIATAGLQSTVTDALSHTRTTVVGIAGKPVSITDTTGKTLSSIYDGEGNLLQVADSRGNLHSYTYDNYGNKVSDSDPDLGSWSYTYDALGRQLTQTDALTQQTILGYDILGRMVSRQEVGMSSVWVYDTAAHGVGMLAETYSLLGDGVTKDYDRTLSYDALSRLSGDVTTKRIDPNAGVSDPDFSYSWSYDPATGRLASVTYPGGFSTTDVYDGNGYLYQVKNTASNLVYWQAVARDAMGHLTAEQLGNGLRTNSTYKPDTGLLDTITSGTLVNGTFTATVQNDAYNFDAAGNLLNRSQYVGGNSLFESYTYDSLYRLNTSSLVNGTITVNKSASYDELGNIQARSDVGTYGYTGCGGVHRVCGITGGANPAFGYNANGNMQSGNGRSYTWTSFNMPVAITRGTLTDSFAYSTAHERVRQVSTDTSTGQTTTTVYLNPRLDQGDTFEKVYKPNGDIQRMYHVYGDAGVVANITQLTHSGTTTSATVYYHTDHLGSIIATTDDSGTVLERMSFDAWGKRRNIDGTDTTSSLATTTTMHGFTGHEELDSMGLVHMNGRVYDPLVGRFVSADPNVFYPDDQQDYNAYSYVHNNPLSATDPSGYWDAMSDIGLSDYAINSALSFQTTWTGYQSTYSFAYSGSYGVSNSTTMSWTGSSVSINYGASAQAYNPEVALAAQVAQTAGPILQPRTNYSNGGSPAVTQTTAQVLANGLRDSHGYISASGGGSHAAPSAPAQSSTSSSGAGLIQAITQNPVVQGTFPGVYWFLQGNEAAGRGELLSSYGSNLLGVGEVLAAIYSSGSSGWINIVAKGARGVLSSIRRGVQAEESEAAKEIKPEITAPYKRPSGATTRAQRESVQGKPCVKCGAETPRQVAGHKDALVKEYYETGTIDKGRMRSTDAVQPECPTCSAREGADMSRYSRQQREDRGL